MRINNRQLFISRHRAGSASRGSAGCCAGTAKQGEALYALTIQIKGQTSNDGDPVTLCGGQQGASCASSGGEVGPSFPILLTSSGKTRRSHRCCAASATKMVRYVVIYTVMLPGILGGGNIPL